MIFFFDFFIKVLLLQIAHHSKKKLFFKSGSVILYCHAVKMQSECSHFTSLSVSHIGTERKVRIEVMHANRLLTA